MSAWLFLAVGDSAAIEAVGEATPALYVADPAVNPVRTGFPSGIVYPPESNITGTETLTDLSVAELKPHWALVKNDPSHVNNVRSAVMT